MVGLTTGFLLMAAIPAMLYERVLELYWELREKGDAKLRGDPVGRLPRPASVSGGLVMS